MISIHFDANSNEFTQLERTGHLYLGPQYAPPLHLLVPPHVSQAPLPLPNSVELPNHYFFHNFGWDVLPPSPRANTTGWGKFEHNRPIPSTVNLASSGHHEKIPHTTENPPKSS